MWREFQGPSLAGKLVLAGSSLASTSSSEQANKTGRTIIRSSTDKLAAGVLLPPVHSFNMAYTATNPANCLGC